MTLIPWSSLGSLEKVETWVLRDHHCPGPDTSAVARGTWALIAALAVIRDKRKYSAGNRPGSALRKGSQYWHTSRKGCENVP